MSNYTNMRYEKNVSSVDVCSWSDCHKDSSIIDMTVIVLSCNQLTEITARSSTDQGNHVNLKGKHVKRAIYSQCKNNIVTKENFTFISNTIGIRLAPSGTASECAQWCLEFVTCSHIGTFRTLCYWVGNDAHDLRFRPNSEHTSTSILFRCLKYYTCADRACQNNATCKPLNTYEQEYLQQDDVGMEFIYTEGWYGLFCEHQY